MREVGDIGAEQKHCIQKKDHLKKANDQPKKTQQQNKIHSVIQKSRERERAEKEREEKTNIRNGLQKRKCSDTKNKTQRQKENVEQNQARHERTPMPREINARERPSRSNPGKKRRQM